MRKRVDGQMEWMAMKDEGKMRDGAGRRKESVEAPEEEERYRTID